MGDHHGSFQRNVNADDSREFVRLRRAVGKAQGDRDRAVTLICRAFTLRWLEHGRWVSGVEILKVTPGGPGDSARLQGSRLGVLQTTILMTGFVASAFFPPHLDVADLKEGIEKARAGEVVYLTVVRHGRREQIRLALPIR